MQGDPVINPGDSPSAADGRHHFPIVIMKGFLRDSSKRPEDIFYSRNPLLFRNRDDHWIRPAIFRGEIRDVPDCVDVLIIRNYKGGLYLDLRWGMIRESIALRKSVALHPSGPDDCLCGEDGSILKIYLAIGDFVNSSIQQDADPQLYDLI